MFETKTILEIDNTMHTCNLKNINGQSKKK